MSMTADEANWRRVRTSLAFRIGPWAFWYWRFDALADTRHFTELAPDEALQTLLVDERIGSCRLLPSYPVSAPPPALRLEHDAIVYTPRVFPNYYVDLGIEGGFEAYLQRFSSKSRSTLRRKLRRFAEAGPAGALDWRVYATEVEMQEFLEIAGALSAKTYQARVLDVGLPATPEFRREAIERAREGSARGFVLFLGEQAAAYVYTGLRAGVASYDHVGHDPALNALSPGTVLQYLVLQHLFADPRVRVFDFTEGEGDHKAFFSTDKRLCAKSFAFPRRASTLALVRLHAWTQQLDGSIDALLERWALKQRIRRYVRAA